MRMKQGHPHVIKNIHLHVKRSLSYVRFITFRLIILPILNLMLMDI